MYGGRLFVTDSGKFAALIRGMAREWGFAPSRLFQVYVPGDPDVLWAVSV